MNILRCFISFLVIGSIYSLNAQELRRNIGEAADIPVMVTGRIIPDCKLSDAYIDLGVVELSTLNSAGSVTPLVQSKSPLTIDCQGSDAHTKLSIQFKGETNDKGHWTIQQDKGSARGVGIQLFYYQHASEPLMIDSNTTLFSSDFENIDNKYVLPVAARVISDGEPMAGNIVSMITLALRME